MDIFGELSLFGIEVELPDGSVRRYETAYRHSMVMNEDRWEAVREDYAWRRESAGDVLITHTTSRWDYPVGDDGLPDPNSVDVVFDDPTSAWGRIVAIFRAGGMVRMEDYRRENKWAPRQYTGAVPNSP